MAISEVAKKLGISVDTLRYYEKLGLIRRVRRSGGKRHYAEHDIGWIEFIKRLKATGMSLSQIREYSELRYLGNSTVSERRAMLEEHALKVEADIKRLQRNQKVLRKKIELYKKMEEDYGTV